VKPLDAMLAEFVTPVLRRAGFRKTRRTYRLAAPNGSQSLINFQGYPLSMSHTTFFVNVAVTVEAVRAWSHAGLTPSIPYRAEPSIWDGFWSHRVYPPRDVEWPLGEFTSEIWCFEDAEGATRCGKHLVRILTEETVPFLTRMLDRREQLALLHDPAEDEHLRLGSNSFGDVLLLVDDGPFPELDAALTDAERQGDHELVFWARERLAARRRSDNPESR
jgi:hypothetical protein